MNSLRNMTGLCTRLTPALLLVVVLSGCSTTPYTFQDPSGTNVVSAPVSIPPTQATTTIDDLQPGHRITITFSGTTNPPQKHEEKIREDGYISPPQLREPVKAAGKTVGQLQKELHGLYVPAYYRTLTVTVTTEERWFYVGGEVKNANRFPYSGELTVLKAIQVAGHFTTFANRKKVKVIRANGKTETVNCDKALKDPRLDLAIFPGDQVIVRQRPF